MKTLLNNHQLSAGWVEQAVRAHPAVTAIPADSETPSPEFRTRCQAAA